MPAQLHFPKHAFALHLLLKRLQRLINVVVANEYLHLAAFSSPMCPECPGALAPFRTSHGAEWRAIARACDLAKGFRRTI